MAANATVEPAHAHGHAHPAGPVAHHFDDLRQQQDTVRLGMWLFLVTEVLFFGGAFCAYTAYRIWFPKEFEAGSAALNVGIATVNTFLLLTSSLTVTLAVRAAYVRDQKLLQVWLGLTIILGSVFLGLKGREYWLDYEEGLIPGLRQGAQSMGPNLSTNRPEPVHQTAFVGNLEHVLQKVGYDTTGVDMARVQLFFLFYYIMTALHVIHMVIGIGLLGWQWTLAKFGWFQFQSRYVYVEVLALYWHFVDLVWIFLLPLLYLAGPHNGGQVIEGLKQAFGLAAH